MHTCRWSNFTIVEGFYIFLQYFLCKEAKQSIFTWFHTGIIMSLVIMCFIVWLCVVTSVILVFFTDPLIKTVGWSNLYFQTCWSDEKDYWDCGRRGRRAWSAHVSFHGNNLIPVCLFDTCNSSRWLLWRYCGHLSGYLLRICGPFWGAKQHWTTTGTN